MEYRIPSHSFLVRLVFTAWRRRPGCLHPVPHWSRTPQSKLTHASYNVWKLEPDVPCQSIPSHNSAVGPSRLRPFFLRQLVDADVEPADGTAYRDVSNDAQFGAGKSHRSSLPASVPDGGNGLRPADCGRTAPAHRSSASENPIAVLALTGILFFWADGI